MKNCKDIFVGTVYSFGDPKCEVSVLNEDNEVDCKGYFNLCNYSNYYNQIISHSEGDIFSRSAWSSLVLPAMVLLLTVFKDTFTKVSL